MPLTWLTDVVFSKVSPPPHIILICTLYYIFYFQYAFYYAISTIVIINNNMSPDSPAGGIHTSLIAVNIENKNT